MTLDPGGIIAWLVVGLIAGWLAGMVMKGGGYGVVGDIVIGIVGALVGGFVFSLFTGGGTAGFWGSIAVAFVGAVILIAIVRAIRHAGYTPETSPNTMAISMPCVVLKAGMMARITSTSGLAEVSTSSAWCWC